MKELKYNFYDCDFIYEINWEDEKEVIKEVLQQESGLTEKEAETTLQVLTDNGLTDEFIDRNMEFVKEYFEEEAYEEYKYWN